MDVRTPGAKPRSKLVSRGSLRSLLIAGFAGLSLVGCSSQTEKPVVEPAPTPVTVDAETAQPGFALNAASYNDLPGWSQVDPVAAMSALAGSCTRFKAMSPTAPISRSAAYDAGFVRDWSIACIAVENGQARTAVERRELLETYFAPFEVSADASLSKLTGYFEPMLRVNDYSAPGFETAIPAKPDDIVTADLSQFHGSPGPGRIVGKVVGGKFIPYDERAEIVDDPGKAIAWADAGDVFYLQIQGSGRLQFPDGRQMRAAFAAHNGQPFKSIARYLIDAGEIEPHQAGMKDIKAWLKRVGLERAREVMNVNPRYVWFGAEAINNPDVGPKGAQGVPLTPMASIAVDPSFHPYGVPIFMDTLTPKRPGDWEGAPFQQLVVAQDTGGAIRGALRADLFFGWGEEAGDRAAVTNHPVAMWVLLPRTTAHRQGLTVQ